MPARSTWCCGSCSRLEPLGACELRGARLPSIPTKFSPLSSSAVPQDRVDCAPRLEKMLSLPRESEDQGSNTGSLCSMARRERLAKNVIYPSYLCETGSLRAARGAHGRLVPNASRSASSGALD